jgi:hypothetical protein
LPFCSSLQLAAFGPWSIRIPRSVLIPNQQFIAMSKWRMTMLLRKPTFK